ncbi:hypothetical protein KSP39_PZI012721 [Platanthera zijinensis]|uniref:Reverse transcriptase domain-containing protein n=1 Tax=Platanthera zijinensis TaxID=2320716 RepID=A0AAP0G543_9ASPA
MKLAGTLRDRSIVVMVDSGASHNFLSAQLAHQLHLPLVPSPDITVCLGDGRRQLTHECCTALSLTVGSCPAIADFYAFGLDDIDAILGSARWAKCSFEVPTGLPPARPTDHAIPLQPGTVSVCPYRYDHVQKDVIEWLVHEMLMGGLIRPSASPFSILVLLVRKRDGSWRFCVDYREFNKVTIPDMYPIPVIHDLLDKLHDSIFFTKLELRAGYHQIRVRPEDIPKNAFRTHDVHCKFLVMPFVLSNASATFQAMMNDIFWADHLQCFRLTLTTIRYHCLKLHPKKCSFGASEVSYIGHTISAWGVIMDEEKIAEVLLWPTPTSLRDVRGFLSLTGYYRRFIKGTWSPPARQPGVHQGSHWESTMGLYQGCIPYTPTRLRSHHRSRQIAWVGIPTAPAWLPTEMLIKVPFEKAFPLQWRCGQTTSYPFMFCAKCQSQISALPASFPAGCSPSAAVMSWRRNTSYIRLG